MYLAALGNLTAAVGADETEYASLRILVDEAENRLEFANTEISRHQIHGPAVQISQGSFAAAAAGISLSVQTNTFEADR